MSDLEFDVTVTCKKCKQVIAAVSKLPNYPAFLLHIRCKTCSQTNNPLYPTPNRITFEA